MLKLSTPNTGSYYVQIRYSEHWFLRTIICFRNISAVNYSAGAIVFGTQYKIYLRKLFSGKTIFVSIVELAV